MNFFDKLSAARVIKATVCGLDPNPEMMPTRYCSKGDSESIIRGLWDWLQYQIAQTSDFVCAYKPTLGFALGVQGLELLQQTLKAIPAHIPIILEPNTVTSTPVLFCPNYFSLWWMQSR